MIAFYLKTVFDVPGPRRRLVGQDSQLQRRNYWNLARQIHGPSPRQLTHPTIHQAKCPGSDVELGFPSGGVFVAGMLKDFWGSTDSGRAASQNTTIELSSRQAHVGAQVPFSLSVCQSCPVCAGRGELSSTSCGSCHGLGTGQVPHTITLSLPAGVRHGTVLYFLVTLPYSSSTQIEALIEVRD